MKTPWPLRMAVLLAALMLAGAPALAQRQLGRKLNPALPPPVQVEVSPMLRVATLTDARIYDPPGLLERLTDFAPQSKTSDGVGLARLRGKALTRPQSSAGQADAPVLQADS
jgi:hypothetical protein